MGETTLEVPRSPSYNLFKCTIFNVWMGQTENEKGRDVADEHFNRNSSESVKAF